MMKKSTLIIVILGFSIFLLTACGSMISAFSTEKSNIESLTCAEDQTGEPAEDQAAESSQVPAAESYENQTTGPETVPAAEPAEAPAADPASEVSAAHHLQCGTGNHSHGDPHQYLFSLWNMRGTDDPYILS